MTILDHFDNGHTPAECAVLAGVSLSTVYNVLREHRPDRKRAARAGTSDKTVLIRGLASVGIKPARIAELAVCSRAYVYKQLSERNDNQ